MKKSCMILVLMMFAGDMSAGYVIAKDDTLDRFGMGYLRSRIDTITVSSTNIIVTFDYTSSSLWPPAWPTQVLTSAGSRR